MIVKNEAHNLREWIEDAAEHVDEIIAVDTGSTDDTIAVLESVNARILHQPWAEDFAKHRNFGLSQATTDWLLVLDADERLKRVHWFTLSYLLRNEDVMAYSFTVKNYHSQTDLSSFDTMKSYRLFRNKHDILYSGAVHNQLGPAIQAACRKTGMITQHSFITIDHYGYALNESDKAKKHERIYRMVKRQVGRDPFDEYYLFHLLNICLAMGKYKEAREAAAKIDMDKLRPELRIKAYYKAAQVELHYNMHQKARAFLRHALLLAPDAAFLHYLLSNVLYQMRRFSAGLRSAYRALDYSKEKSSTTTLIHLPLDECLSNLGVGYLLSKKYAEAQAYFLEALDHNKENTTATKYIQWIQDNVGDIEPVSKSLSKKPPTFSYPT